MNILALHKTGEVYTRYHDVDSLINFFTRTGRFNSYQVIVTKGNKALNIEKIENPADLRKTILEFVTQS